MTVELVMRYQCVSMGSDIDISEEEE